MIKLVKLYSLPEVFKPIDFTDGINLILGEKVSAEKVKTRKDRKTNGVGKSMSIEFINFCLLKDAKDSRVMKIPLDKLSEDVKIKLDLLINNKKVTITRTKEEHEKPIIEVEDKLTQFSKLDDALKYLNELFYDNSGEESDVHQPSFRELISPLIRDEDSEFKDIIGSHDLGKRIPAVNLVGAHLYFFNIDSSIVKDIRDSIVSIEAKSKAQSYLKTRLTDDGRKKITEIKSELNALEREMEYAEKSLNKFESEPIFKENQDHIATLDSEIDNLRTRQGAIRLELNRIDSMPKIESIDLSDVEIVYNKFKSGLGSMLSESFEKVVLFKSKIEKYQKSLIDGKAKLLRDELDKITKRTAELDEKRADILRQVDNKGILKDFKNSFSLYSKRKEDLAGSLSNLTEFEAVQRKIKQLKLEKDNLFAELDNEIFEADNSVRSFEQTLISMHEYIMGNAKASFEIKSINGEKNKQIVKLEFRIDNDGSHSVDRTKVFIYDVALMLNQETRTKHPLFLIHDNIFDVDQDTLVQSLNYLAEQENKGTKFQYILTLNRDKIEHEENSKEIKLDINSHTRASFKRTELFLKTSYQEVDTDI